MAEKGFSFLFSLSVVQFIVLGSLIYVIFDTKRELAAIQNELRPDSQRNGAYKSDSFILSRSSRQADNDKPASDQLFEAMSKWFGTSQIQPVIKCEEYKPGSRKCSVEPANETDIQNMYYASRLMEEASSRVMVETIETVFNCSFNDVSKSKCGLQTGPPGRDGEKGEKGDKGNRGQRGKKGVEGEKGEQGDDGRDGRPGSPGNDGRDGIPGDKGSTGEKGAYGTDGIGQPGAKGDPGSKGDVGFPGERGLTGATGDPGPKGDIGPPGERGLNGTKGDHGPKGLRGDMGLTGAQGQKGDKGGKGQKGVRGEVGWRGDKGDFGAKGQKGQRGYMGLTGAKGQKGGMGLRGYSAAKGQKGQRGYIGQKGQKGQKGNGYELTCSRTCYNGGTCIPPPNDCRCRPGWTGEHCRQAVCGSPPSISNGSPGTPTSTTAGGTVTYRCNSGYVRSGSATVTCQSNGQWSTRPTCKADVNECTLRTHNCQHICVNTVGSYSCSCHSGYVLLGDRRTCRRLCGYQLCPF